MVSTQRISQLRSRFVSELKTLESELSSELNRVQDEISRLGPAQSQRRTRSTGSKSAASTKSTGTKNKTVSILSGKICPKCGKKGHDLRWHRWNDRRAAGQNSSRRTA